jgi:hypothetical protein
VASPSSLSAYGRPTRSTRYFSKLRGTLLLLVRQQPEADSRVCPTRRALAHARRAAGITPAAVDCGAALPSGKTIMERFFAGQEGKDPLFFVAANKDKPRSFTVQAHVTPSLLLGVARNATQARVTSVESQEDLRQACFRRRQCAVVVHERDLAPAHAALLARVAGRVRRVALATVDARVLKFSLEDTLPAAAAPGQPRVVFLQREAQADKKGSKGAARFLGKAFKGSELDERPLVDFIEAAASGEQKLARLKSNPAVSKRKGDKDKDKAGKGSTKSKGAASSGSKSKSYQGKSDKPSSGGFVRPRP